MRVKVLEPLETKHGVVHPGKIISVPPETVARLGGKVKPVPFDSSHWRRLTSNMISGFGDRDPGGGCWIWIKEHRLGLWEEHRAALADLDRSFHDGDEEAAEQALTRAEQTFLDCLGTWGNRHHLTQLDLVPTLGLRRSA